jgi:hypothetical protein
MVQLPELILPTVDAIYKHYIDSSGDFRRNHLGASLIGSKCERSLWYTFRWCTNPQFSGRVLRLFETGNQQEPRLIKNLREVGIEVYDTDPDTKNQIHYEMYGGHYAGSLDGIGVGFKESKQYHVLEFKTSNVKLFNELKKNGVAAAKPEHYAQMNQYMKWSGLERAYYFVVCKDNDDIYGERVSLDKELVKRLEQKASRVIFSDRPSFKISDSPNDPTCRFCNHKDICRGIYLPEVNCRTCVFAKPEENGTWICTRDNTLLCSTKQRETLSCHVFVPDLVPLEQTDANPEKGTITYGSVENGPGAILSQELQEALDKLSSGEIEI